MHDIVSHSIDSALGSVFSIRCSVASHLFGGFVEGHRSVDQFETVLHFQHELLPVQSHLLSAGADSFRVVVACLQHGFCFLLHLQGALMGLLQRVSMEQRL